MCEAEILTGFAIKGFSFAQLKFELFRSSSGFSNLLWTTEEYNSCIINEISYICVDFTSGNGIQFKSMNKKIGQFLIILFVCFIISCKEKNSNVELSTQVVQQVDSISITNLDKRTYLTDARYLNFDYETKLKHGYRLDYRVYVENTNKFDTLQAIFLMKDSNEIIELNGEISYKLPLYNLGYIGADFDSTFVLVQSYGSGNPHEMQLIHKETGVNLRKGTWVDADEKEQILLYIENEHEVNEKLILFDTKNNRETISTGFEKSKCAQHNVSGLRDCVEIEAANAKVIILKIETEEEKITKKYTR